MSVREWFVFWGEIKLNIEGYFDLSGLPYWAVNDSNY
jgi:hypothetical protein